MINFEKIVLSLCIFFISLSAHAIGSIGELRQADERAIDQKISIGEAHRQLMIDQAAQRAEAIAEEARRKKEFKLKEQKEAQRKREFAKKEAEAIQAFKDSKTNFLKTNTIEDEKHIRITTNKIIKTNGVLSYVLETKVYQKGDGQNYLVAYDKYEVFGDDPSDTKQTLQHATNVKNAITKSEEPQLSNNDKVTRVSIHDQDFIASERVAQNSNSPSPLTSSRSVTPTQSGREYLLQQKQELLLDKYKNSAPTIEKAQSYVFGRNALDYSIQKRIDKAMDEAEQFFDISLEILNFITDMSPLGVASDFYRLTTGLDTFTQRELSSNEMALAGIGVATFGLASKAKALLNSAVDFSTYILRNSSKVESAIKFTYKIIDSALGLGVKTPQGIEDLAHAFNNVAGNQVGAVGRSIDDLVKASKTFTGYPKKASQYINSMKPFKNSKFTEAGRNLTKHPKVMGYNSTEIMRKTLNTEEKINKAAQGAVENIIKNGKELRKTQGRYGKIVEYRLDNGYGARFLEESNEMIGFIEP